MSELKKITTKEIKRISNLYRAIKKGELFVKPTKTEKAKKFENQFFKLLEDMKKGNVEII